MWLTSRWHNFVTESKCKKMRCLDPITILAISPFALEKHTWSDDFEVIFEDG